MAIYLSNAFSLQMLQGEEEVLIKVKPVTPEQARELLGKNFISCVGHADTANVVGSILSLPVPHNRQAIALQKGDVLIVAQLTGGRLPEGATTLPEGFKIKFYAVTLQ